MRYKKTLAVFSLLIFSALLLVFSCRKDNSDSGEPYKNTPYTQEYPSHFPAPVFPSENPMTVEGVELGRKLYYDPIISNDERSCGGCHNQQYSFTTFSSNALVHVNLAWNSRFLWNGKIEGTMEDIMKFEVEEFFQTDVSKLNSHAEYPLLFKKAFGVNTITKKEVAHALAQFFRSLVSGNSRFDRFLRKEITLTPSELSGYNIFSTEKGDCFHCHTSPLFTDNNYHNIGLDSIFTGSNQGRYLISSNSSDLGKMKSPTLRNVELSAPYMHDGRFNTLEEVISHYNTGVKLSPTLDPIMTKPGKEFGLNLSQQDIKDLVAFLKSLTDTTFTNNPKFSKP